MPRLTLAFAFFALAAGTLAAEARPRFRLGTSPKPPPVPAASTRAPGREPSTGSYRPGFVVLPGARSPISSTSRPDLPTGSVVPALVTPAVATQGAPKEHARPSRDPCPSSQLFGTGVGFCAVD